ncbi:GDP-L-fucose synthase, partial [Desulfovibrio sp. OttesenSCG-928-C14]|nr:GDP-L-fucose synthase [Desulfovibrio sp. OttesenSCG-928-C14]
MDLTKKIYVAGHEGLLGQALCRKLEKLGARDVITSSREELDLCNQASTELFFATARPDYVFLCAALDLGILGHLRRPADMLLENLQIQNNVIDAARRCGSRKLLFFASSGAYPKTAPRPIREDCLLDGPLEEATEEFALAKIAGIKLCAASRRQYGFDAISAVPVNLYGPGDYFHPEYGRILAALMRRISDAMRAGLEEVVLPGTGLPLHEFMYVDDLAGAAVKLMGNYSAEKPVNIGSGLEIRVSDLARRIAKLMEYRGKIVMDPSGPEAAPRKLLDYMTMQSMNWWPSTSFDDGL